VAVQSGGGEDLAVSGSGEISFLTKLVPPRGPGDFVIRVKSVRFEPKGKGLVVRTGREHDETAKLIFHALHVSPA
jgi:hypothetical protein